MERIKRIFSASPAVVYTCRPSGDFGATFISENIKDQVGYSPEEFTGNANFWAEHIHPDDKEETFAELEKLFTNNTLILEYRFRKSDGVYVWMRDELRLMRDAKGQPLEIVGSWLNITDRKKMEIELHRSISHKRNFISTAAHELRTPLAVIVGYLELLINVESFTEEEKKEFLNLAFEKCLYLEGIFDELLDINRLESGQLISINKSNIDVLDYFSDIFNVIKTDYTTHDFSLDIQAQGCKTNLDDGKIRRVVVNIVSNAVKYSNSGGCIRLSVIVKGNDLYFSCEDEGCGFTNDQIEHAFESFYKGDTSNIAPSGTGLGLSIVKQIIDAHNGEVWIDSEPMKGSKVSFKLPLDTESHSV